MDLSVSGYLETLALLSITFGGFAVLVAVFRQMIGGRLSDHDLYFIRNTLLRSSMVAGCSMLPLLLALYELPPSVIWRLSSLITGLLLILFTLSTYLKRRAVTRTAITKSFAVNAFLQILTALFLLLTANAKILTPAPGHFAAAVSIIMVTAVIGYMTHLGLLLQENRKGSQ